MTTTTTGIAPGPPPPRALPLDLHHHGHCPWTSTTTGIAPGPPPPWALPLDLHHHGHCPWTPQGPAGAPRSPPFVFSQCHFCRISSSDMEVLGYRVDYSVAVYIVAVIEYTAADILKFTGIYVKNIRHTEITSQDIKVAICADQVLVDMFTQEEDITAMMIEDEPVRRESMTYEEIVKDFILEETQYLRDLNMIIKVFRAPFADLFPRSKDLDVIFSNILDIYEFTTKLLSSVEDQMEVAQDNQLPLVGTCFEDLAEVWPPPSSLLFFLSLSQLYKA
ncbi:hypothetical protein ACOMHN_037338 [Nucella lapillus]